MGLQPPSFSIDHLLYTTLFGLCRGPPSLVVMQGDMNPCEHGGFWVHPARPINVITKFLLSVGKVF